MKPTARFIPLREIVDDYKIEADLPESAHFRLWQMAVRGMQEIGFDIFVEPVTRKLGVNPNLTVDLPQDYVNWVKVGVLNDEGEIATLRYNPDLSSNAVLAGDRLSNITDNRIEEFDDKWFWGYRNLYWENEYFKFFGAPSGTNNLGEFDVKEDLGLIFLKPGFSYDYVILEYLPDPGASEDFLVPVYARECILAWIAWRDIINKPGSRRVTGNEKVLRKREYFNTRNLLRRRLNPFRIPDANDTIREGQKLAVKS